MKSHRQICSSLGARSAPHHVATACVVAVAALSLLVGCGRSRATSADGIGRNVSGPVLRVVVQRPVLADSTSALLLPGSIEAWESATLFGRVSGYLDSVSVDIGDRVDAGAELARLVVPEMVAELASARAHVAAARAARELALVTEKRNRELLERNPEAISPQLVDEAAAEAGVADAGVSVAVAELERLQTLMRFSVLRAPFDGRITKRYLHPGALVNEGGSSNAQPVLEIARTDRLRVVFELPEPVVSRVSRGAAARLMLDAYPGQTIEGRISRVAGALDPKTRAMRAEVDLDNHEGGYQPGMYAKVLLDIDAHPGALALPSSAVHGHRDDRYVLVAENGSLRRQPVVVVSDDGRKSVISEGLSTETLVMVAGSPLAGEGSTVEAVEEGAGP